MEIHFLGVGEACDPNEPNTSILLQTNAREKNGKILLDCGFSVPHQYISLEPPPDELEILWISHFHGDHFLGAPLLLLWFWEMGRQKPLHIAGPPGVETKIVQAMELAYANLLSRLGFSLIFHEMEPGVQHNIFNIVWQAAYNEHSQPCLSLRLELHGKAIFYSGDGRPTPLTLALAAGCDIIIHEAYALKDTTPGHGSISSCLDFARKAGTRKLALVHMQRHVRPHALAVVIKEEEKKPGIDIVIPAHGSTISL
jgi:ribonuclease BN (tRNA processing enzyme)